MSMPKLTVAFAVFLILLGALAYVLSGMESFTALIPSIFGVLFLIPGLVSFKDSMRKHMMHVTSLLALVTIIALLPMVSKGYNADRPLAFPSQLVMLMGTIAYLGLCVKSFIDARKARRITEGS